MKFNFTKTLFKDTYKIKDKKRIKIWWKNFRYGFFSIKNDEAFTTAVVNANIGKISQKSSNIILIVKFSKDLI
jgi:hypothetical protein